MPKHDFVFPFEPPWEDLKMTVPFEEGPVCYVFDTCCKDFDPEQKRERDQRIMKIWNWHVRKKIIKEIMREEAQDAGQ